MARKGVAQDLLWENHRAGHILVALAYMRQSAQVPWSDEALASLEQYRQTLPEYRRHEKYGIQGLVWDVVKGLYLADDGRFPCTAVVAGLVDCLGFLAPPDGPIFRDGKQVGWRGYAGIRAIVNEQGALDDQTDLERPLLAITIGPPGRRKDQVPLLIDGQHRVYKAWKSGITTLPCHLLSLHKGALIRIIG